MSTTYDRMRQAANDLEHHLGQLSGAHRLRADADELERVEEELRRAWNAERPFGAPQLYRVAADRIRGEMK